MVGISTPGGPGRHGIRPRWPSGPKVPVRRIPPFIAGETYDLVLSTLEQDRTLLGRRDLGLIGTMLLAGLRVFELVALRLVDVDLTEGHLYVAHGKGDRDRYVTAPPRLCIILSDYMTDVRPARLGEASSPWLFVPREPTMHRLPDRRLSVLPPHELGGAEGRQAVAHAECVCSRRAASLAHHRQARLAPPVSAQLRGTSPVEGGRPRGHQGGTRPPTARDDPHLREHSELGAPGENQEASRMRTPAAAPEPEMK
jgi:hypothetical protein